MGVCVCVCVCWRRGGEGWGGENRGEGGVFGELIVFLHQSSDSRGLCAGSVLSTQEGAGVKTAAPGYRKHTDLGLGTPEV